MKDLPRVVVVVVGRCFVVDDFLPVAAHRL